MIESFPFYLDDIMTYYNFHELKYGSGKTPIEYGDFLCIQYFLAANGNLKCLFLLQSKGKYPNKVFNRWRPKFLNAVKKQLYKQNINFKVRIRKGIIERI